MARNPLLRQAPEEPEPVASITPPIPPAGPQPPAGVLFDGVGDLRIAATAVPAIPDPVEYIPLDHEVERAIAAILSGRNVCVVGPPGCGKTTMLHHIANRLKRAVVAFQCGRGVTLEHLVGFRDLTKVGEATVTNVVPGPVMRAMLHGAIAYLDEIDRLDESVAENISSALDFRRELNPPEWRGLTIKAKPGFVVVSSTNTDFIRDGRAIPDHIRDRFVFIRMTYLPAAKEASLIVKATKVKPDVADRIVEVAKRLREAKTKPTAAGKTFKSWVSTRSLIDWAAMVVQGLSIRDAGLLALVEKIPLSNPADEALARDTLDAVLPAETKNLKGAGNPDDLGEVVPAIVERKFGKVFTGATICASCSEPYGKHHATTHQCPTGNGGWQLDDPSPSETLRKFGKYFPVGPEKCADCGNTWGESHVWSACK